MIASDMLREVAAPRLPLITRRLVAATLLLTGLIIVWIVVHTASMPPFVQVVFWLYTAVNLALVSLTLASSAPAHERAALLLSLICDAGLSMLLLAYGSGGVGIYLLYGLVVSKAALLCATYPAVLLVPCLLGLSVLASSFGLAASPWLVVLAQSSLFAGMLGSGGALVWLTHRQGRQVAGLSRKLLDERMQMDVRLHEMEETATDLRTRVRELQSLGEGLRVISSSLSLNEVLKLITSGTSELLGASRVANAALTLFDGDRQLHHFLGSSQLTMPSNWPEQLAMAVARNGQPLLTVNLAKHPEWAALARHGVGSLIGVPIIDQSGAVLGALTVISRSSQGFASSDMRHLAALAAQASIALRNAGLHDKLLRQQALLEGVIRDISDGLVVVDAAGEIIVANPSARSLIVADSFADKPLGQRLISLAAELRAAGQESAAVELKIIDQQGRERVCQAFATLIGLPEGQGYVAVMLHDITAHREEMRERTEFVSMVSHELRNPIHSLNGFLKVVLQGRAGTLNETQQEFLSLAALQVEQLTGRIGELLEFNRLEAGRLSLHPEPADLVLITRATMQKLQFQAEQAGIELINRMPVDLPEIYMDSERIGQVLTNLVENAFKATTPSGTVTVSATLCDQAIQVAVSDTGTGIPKAEQAKIFGRFYQMRNQTAHHGGHLGLGLTICQQIVEGHQGRIWVESEEGRGSTFIFSLPLSTRLLTSEQVA